MLARVLVLVVLAAPAAASSMSDGECVHWYREACPTVHFDAKGRPSCGKSRRIRVAAGECAGRAFGPRDFREDDIEPEGLDDYARWRYASRPVPDEVLASMTADMLRVLRNTFFAGHGRVFQDRALDAFFRGFSWYKPRPDFRESDLGEAEKKNVARAAFAETARRKRERKAGHRFPALEPFMSADQAEDRGVYVGPAE